MDKQEAVWASLPEAFTDYLSEIAHWYENVENFRHALAHRIPLYIPPGYLTDKKAVEYNDIQMRINDAVRQRDFEAAERLEDEQAALLSFHPIATHSFDENSKMLYLGIIYLTETSRSHILYRTLKRGSVMAQKAPGKSHREGITLMQLTDMFPDDATASAWFESLVWPDGRHCPRCGCTETRDASQTSGLPYYCPACQRAFSVRIGTALERSKVSMRQWVFAIYLDMTSLKGVSSMKLHRDIGVSQKTAWFILHRIREAWSAERDALFSGPVEADETYMGGRRKNMPKSKRQGLTGRGAVGKAAVVGAKDRTTKRVSARVVESTDAHTLQGFVRERTAPGAKVFTDESRAYEGLGNSFDHEAVNHSVGEYVRDMAHTNGIESFWSMLKRAHKGTFHKISTKHLQRYVNEFAGRHNVREVDTIRQMESVVIGLVGKRLMYKDLII